jgi:4-hydroxy-3-polyprenylbenzoate decarboxylase
MAISVGQAPVLGVVASVSVRPGESEYAVAGGRIGKPIDVVRGKVTDLPLPADAELVFEGFMPPPSVESRPEGPFGEWPGYYASDNRPEPVLQVKAVYYRDDAIVIGQPPTRPTLPGRQINIPRTAALWDAIEAAGVPEVRGVWKLAGGGLRLIDIIQIKQVHAGHAKMAGLVAAGCHPGAYMTRLVIVVDEDLDITNPAEVMWALATRWDPKTATDIIDGCWTGHIDPGLSPAQRGAGDITTSRMIAYAVRPFPWKDEFPKVNMVDSDYAEAVRRKWAEALAYLRK